MLRGGTGRLRVPLQNVPKRGRRPRFCLVVLVLCVLTVVALRQGIRKGPYALTVVSEYGGGTEWHGASWQSHVAAWLASSCGASPYPQVTLKEVISDEGCPADASCENGGSCIQGLDQCSCPMGWKGRTCAEEDVYPCNRKVSSDWPVGVWTLSMCAATCDGKLGRCVCGPTTKYPDRPATFPCGMAKDENNVPKLQVPDTFPLFASDEKNPGWCNADPVSVQSGGSTPKIECGCNHDGQEGRFCERSTEMFCINQCSGQGRCSAGFCECQAGWRGVDCSLPSESTRWSDPPPLWLSPPGQQLEARSNLSTLDATTRAAVAKASWELLGAQPTNDGAVFLGRQTLEIVRPRPLIYVYELTPVFNTHQLQGRKWKFYCATRVYGQENRTAWNGFILYGTESAVYEGLLASPHRTLDPSLADYFYVPVFGGCMMARGPDDSPRFDMSKWGNLRTYYAAQQYEEAFQHISKTYPFWNRNGGKDHIWLFPWDEGACMAPASIWNSIMLTPWGNTMAKHNYSTTAFASDIWSAIPEDLRGTHPCYDPRKDIVIPAWSTPSEAHLSGKYWQRPVSERETFFYFNGNLGDKYEHGRPEEEYSMGIRQLVALYFGSSPTKTGQLGKLSDPDVVVTSVRSEAYSEELSRSRFCGVFPGDGFSNRMETAMMHGCIPVIIQDGIHLPFESVLRYPDFSVRIPEANIPQMIAILRAIPLGQVEAMQAAVARQWGRWTYLSVVRQEGQRQREAHPGEGEDRWIAAAEELSGNDDALETIIQTLHFKLHNDPWRKLAAAAKGKTADSCSSAA